MNATAVSLSRVRAATDEPPRYVLVTVMTAIAMIPVVRPRIPGNAGPADIFMIIATFAVLLWIGQDKRSLVAPFAAGTALLMSAGALAGVVAGRPGATMLVMLQEVHLFLFCAAIATVARTPKALEAVKAAWVLSAVVWGLVLIAAVQVNFTALVSPVRGGTRAALFYQNPNITGGLFMTSFFVVVSSSWPRTKLMKTLSAIIVVIALLLTGSNAALGGLLAGGLLTLLWWLWHRIEPAAALLVAGVALAGGVVAVAAFEDNDILWKASVSENPIVRYSIGRFERSAESRMVLFSEEVEVYAERSILGIGPFATRDVLGENGETGVRSSHNDYLATLIERGPIGVAGLIVLIGSITWRIARSGRRHLKPEWRAAAGAGGAAAGAGIAMLLSALTHEILHYRHLWALMGIIAAVHYWGRQDADEARR